MSLSKEDLQAIQGVIKVEVSDKLTAFEERMNQKFSAQKAYSDAIKEELLGHIDGLAVMISANIQSHDRRIVDNTNQIHGVKDFLKLNK